MTLLVENLWAESLDTSIPVLIVLIVLLLYVDCLRANNYIRNEMRVVCDCVQVIIEHPNYMAGEEQCRRTQKDPFFRTRLDWWSTAANLKHVL